MFWLISYTTGNEAYGDGEKTDELIAKLKNCEVGVMAYGVFRPFGTSLWELIVETNLFTDGEGKTIKSNLNVNGNKVALKLATETGDMVFNFQIQGEIAILGSSTVNWETMDALSASMILTALREDLHASNPTEDEMKKARVAAKKMLSNGFVTAGSKWVQQFCCGLFVDLWEWLLQKKGDCA